MVLIVFVADHRGDEVFLVTHKLAGEMEKLDIPPIPEFIEMIADSGGGQIIFT
jgi:hypothetical protein